MDNLKFFGIFRHRKAWCIGCQLQNPYHHADCPVMKKVEMMV